VTQCGRNSFEISTRVGQAAIHTVSTGACTLRRKILFGLTLVLATIADRSAFADNLGRPMTIQYYPASPNREPEIQVDGDITSETPVLLRRVLAQHGISPSTAIPENPVVFFTSGGGDLSAGIEIGRIIRQYQLNTKVGAHNPISPTSQQILQRFGISLQESAPWSRATDVSALLDTAAGYHPSYCISACTVAFLGGVTRTIVKNSAYAVHQYSVDCNDPQNRTVCSSNQRFLATAQQMSAELATYLEAMGVAEDFLTKMVLAEPSQINILSYSDMLKYRIVYIPSKQQWEVKGAPLGGLNLMFDQDLAGYKTHVEFACTPRRGNPELTLLISGDHNSDRNVALSAQNIEFAYYPDGTRESRFVLNADEIIRYPYQIADGAVGLTIRGTRRIVDALTRTGVFSVTSYVGIDRRYVIFAIVPVDRDKLGGYITSCR
jgi:hypothetical protein